MDKLAAYELLLEDHPLWNKEAIFLSPAHAAEQQRFAKINSKSHELDKAFALYRRETGRSPHKMSLKDISDYVEKVRR